MDVKMFIPERKDRDLYREFEYIVEKNLSKNDKVPYRVHEATLPKFELEKLGVSPAIEKSVEGRLYSITDVPKWDAILQELNDIKPCVGIKLPIVSANPSLRLKDRLLSTGEMGTVRVELNNYMTSKDDLEKFLEDNELKTEPLGRGIVRNDGGNHLHIIQSNFSHNNIFQRPSYV